ncbi:hypothetical protein T459_14681, partial [Capsicum annuum]
MDRITKSAHFLPVRANFSVEDYARLYLHETVKQYGVPISIIFDRATTLTLGWLHLRLYGMRCRSLIGWFEVGEAEMFGLDLVYQAIEKVKVIRDRLQVTKSPIWMSILVSGVVVDRNMTEHYGNSRESSSSASSLNSSLQVTEDDHAIAKILAEEEEIASRYGGKLAKRLSHLDSIPHTPRVIGQIPDPNDATLDHGRLSSRLAAYGLAEFQIQGDGNCQFRALADQLYHNPEYHKHVRKEVVKQLKHFRKFYESYVPMKYKSYLKKMK